MNKETNFFSLEDTSDLPNDVKDLIPVKRLRSKTRKLLELFDHKNPLSFDEITVGMYRLYQIKVSRQWVYATLWRFVKSESIQKVDKGIYEKVERKL